MGSTNPNVWNGNIKEDRKSSFKKTVYLTLSERAFFTWCYCCYEIDKGVYHTINTWFYEQGITNRVFRRIHMVAFLHFLNNIGLESALDISTYLARRRLIKKLHQFLEDEEKEDCLI
jgi:riboflavin kinase